MASFGEYRTIPGLIATATFASKQYYLAKASSTAGEVKPGTSATSAVLGVVQNDAAAAEVAEVAFDGIVKAAAETSVSYGDALTCSSTGRVKATTTNGHRLVGFALEASSSAGDIIRVALSPGFYRST